jgi:aryl-alcohol dehydrogenase-like predicted oxidoreductase
MATLDGFVRAGKVRYVGCSNFTAADIVSAQWAAERVHGTPFVSLQANYSVMARAIEAEILPTCRQHGLGVLAYSPLGSGVLAGRYRRDSPPGPGSRLAEWAGMPGPAARGYVTGLLAARHFDIADEVAGVAADLGTTSATVALAWLARRSAVTSVILGPRTTDQLAAGLAGLAFELPEEAVARLDAASRSTVVPPTNGQHRAA